MANVRNLNNFVTASEVVQNSFTNQATDTALISDSILDIAELAHIKPELGLDFYEELKTQNHNSSLTTDNQTLVTDFLKPALCWFVRFEVMNEIQYNTTSAGLVTNISEFSNPVNVEQFNQMKQDTYRKAKVMLDDMVAYIQHEDQSGKYPLFGHDGDSSMPDVDHATKLNGIIFY
tara:strand:+ start:1242 stop:1769 length:528 start_codon:yes stop_codon:yes gene_type:complete